MIERKLWILTAVTGIALTIFGLFMIDKFPTVGHDISEGFGGPVFAFEMARTQMDVAAVFGPDGDPARAARIAQMNEGNYWDFPFMALYAGFMALFFLAAKKTSSKAVWKWLAGIAVISGLADAGENVILLGLTANIETAPHVGMLFIPVWIKFFSIMACLIGAGVFLSRQRNIIWKILGVVCALGGLTIGAAFISPSDYGYLIRNGVTIGWVIMLIYAVYRAILKPKAL